MSPRFQVQLDREVYAPGETVKGTVLVTEGGATRALEAFLDYREEVEDYDAVATSISSGVLHSGELATGTSFEFELPLPEDALPNYRSEHGELYWELELKSDEAGFDTVERRRVEIAPHGRAAEDAVEPGFAPARPGRQVVTTGARDSERGRGLGRYVRDRGLSGWSMVFLAVGVVTLVIGVVFLVDTVQFVMSSERADGTVVAMTSEIDEEGDEFFYPVVRFTTADGEEVEFRSSSGSSPASHSTGDRVEVLYDPDDPDDAQLSGFFDLWFFTIIPFILGSAFIAFVWFGRRHRSR